MSNRGVVLLVISLLGFIWSLVVIHANENTFDGLVILGLSLVIQNESYKEVRQ